MAYLVLEDGTVYKGESFGYVHDTAGEVVFNTGMTGYQEIITDPSYYGQIVTLTYPLIGNYGINENDPESECPHIKALIVRELCDEPNNWRSKGDLESYLIKYKIPGLKGIDTRALTKRIRENGTMKGVISEEYPDDKKIHEMMEYKVTDAVGNVTAKSIYKIEGKGPKVAVIDYGLKKNILRSLSSRGCNITVYPSSTEAEVILNDNPDGIMLTNGPGDPKDNENCIKNIRKLFNKKPIFGICLGHQLLALASGADTCKLKYGHRGCNHPVKDLAKDRVYITSQNHGYAIVESSLKDNMVISHKNMNDGTIEGIRYNDMDVFSVQFHPEASPGPMDTGYLFDEFISKLK